MAQKFWPQESPRNQFPFDSVPTRRGSIHGGSCVVHYPESYGPILDSVFEMARDIAEGNGVSYESAVSTVLADEGWAILPRHKKLILARLLARLET